MTLQQLKEDARKEFDDKYEKIFHQTEKPIVDLRSMISAGSKEIYGYSKYYEEIDIKDFIDSLITKAYEVGKGEASELSQCEDLNGIPQMEGTMEALNNLTIIKNKEVTK